MVFACYGRISGFVQRRTEKARKCEGGVVCSKKNSFLASSRTVLAISHVMCFFAFFWILELHRILELQKVQVYIVECRDKKVLVVCTCVC